MKLKLQHCKNPDLMYGQGNGTGYWEDAPVDPKTMTIEVADLREAVQKHQAWVERNHLGGGNLTKACGEVREGKKLVAVISYNGRIWSKHWGEEGREEIKLDAGAAPAVAEEKAPLPFERMVRLSVKEAEAFPEIMCNYTDTINDDTVAFHRCEVTGYYVVETNKGQFHAGIDCYDAMFGTLGEAVAWLKEKWGAMTQVGVEEADAGDPDYSPRKDERIERLVALLREARSHIDVSLIRTSAKAHARWEALAEKLDAELANYKA